jgi:hypothetical protein
MLSVYAAFDQSVPERSDEENALLLVKPGCGRHVYNGVCPGPTRWDEGLVR